MPQTQSKGWQLRLTHSTTGRTVSPDVLDDPEFDPSLNSLVTARIPVRKSEDLLEWASGTEVELRLDGREQPLDEVVDFEQEADRTIIVAEGGLELDNRVRTEYQEERRHIAAGEIIEQETTYAADVDTPEFVGQENVPLQEASTTLEFEDLLEIEASDAFEITENGVQTLQSCFVEEAEDVSSFTSFNVSRVDFSGGSGSGVDANSTNARFEIDIELDYDISDGAFAVRAEGTGDDFIAYDILVDGDVRDGIDIVTDDLGWIHASIGSVSSGSRTITMEVRVVGPESPENEIDVVAFYDADFNHDSSLTGNEFDNEVHEDNGYLDDPATKPNAVCVEFDDATTPFIISDATVNISIDDTSNDQAVALSPDRGGSFVEAQNTDTVTATDLETPEVRLRTTLSRYSPDGPRNQTPRLGYASQTIDSFEVVADIRQESLLIDQTFDDSLESVLNQIAGDEFIWSYRLENGTPTVAWSQPGQRTSDSDPDIDADVSVTKNLKTWEAVTIKGSTQSVSAERFDGSTTLQNLDRENIVPGSESVGVIEGGTEFRRSEDYEMRYNDGEIRILGSGDMDTGTEYEIDYRFEVEGTFPQDYEGSNELVETISGVVSDRQAQQLAYTVLEIDPGVRFPSYSADVLLPRGDLFDPLEALSLDQLNLPDEATPIEIREPPQRTPDGIALRLGAQDPLAGLNRLSNQLQSVSRRS